MCELKKYHGTSNTQIDKCMREYIKKWNRAIRLLKPYLDNLRVVACCCGHGKYTKTMILRLKVEGDDEASYFDHYSGVAFPRTRKFYKRDNQGYYYIPEVHKPKEVKETIFRMGGIKP